MLLAGIAVKEIGRDNSDMADAMRYLFDPSAPLHQNLFQSDEKNIIEIQYDPNVAERLPEEERLWRKSLQVGSQVDALKIDFDRNIKVWAKAYVSRMSDDLIEIVFENDSRTTSRTLFWFSPDLDRYDTISEGD